MKPPLTKDTQLCISLAARPSNIGTRFHNHLYEELGLDFIYKAFTTTDIVAAIGGVRALGIRGCSVSMPFKRDVIALVDDVEDSARAIDAVNTIVNDDGRLTASNTDYIAVRALIADNDLDAKAPVVIRGSGGMARAVATAFRDAGFRDGTIVARNPKAGRELAERLGYRWRTDPRVGQRPGDRQCDADRHGRRGRNTTRSLSRPPSSSAPMWFSTWSPCPPRRPSSQLPGRRASG